MRFIYRIKQLMLMGGDMLCFSIAFWLSLAMRYWQIPDLDKIVTGIGPFFVLFIFWLIILFINGLYDLPILNEQKNFKRFGEAALISLVFGTIYFYIIPKISISPKTVLLLNITIGFGLSYIWRAIFNKYINTSTLQTSIIFLGLVPETIELIKILENQPEKGYKIKALIDPDNKTKAEDYPFFEVYHNLSDIKPVVISHQADMLIIAPHLKKDEQALRELYNLFFWKVKITDLTSFYEVITGRISPGTFSEAWFLDHLEKNYPVYEKLKSLLDILIGLILLIFFIVTLPLVALAIRLSSPGPIFYTQKRVGQFKKPFTIYKFRSMFALSPDGGAEIAGARFASKGDVRVTRVGKLLRKTRLDELPQCFNLLKREVTLIGPRPERPEIVEALEKQMSYYSLRHIVKPGITGWAVIHQNYTDNLESSLEKLQYDLFYIKNRSLLLDLVIILRTVNVIMRMMGQ